MQTSWNSSRTDWLTHMTISSASTAAKKQSKLVKCLTWILNNSSSNFVFGLIFCDFIDYNVLSNFSVIC